MHFILLKPFWIKHYLGLKAIVVVNIGTKAPWIVPTQVPHFALSINKAAKTTLSIVVESNAFNHNVIRIDAGFSMAKVANNLAGGRKLLIADPGSKDVNLELGPSMAHRYGRISILS